MKKVPKKAFDEVIEMCGAEGPHTAICLVIIAMLINSTLDPEIVARSAELPLKKVEAIQEQMRKVGYITTDGKLWAEDYSDEQKGGVALVLDVMFVNGELEKLKETSKENS